MKVFPAKEKDKTAESVNYGVDGSMSHRVTVRYVSLNGVASECQGICDRASESLHMIDDVIADISANATKFSTVDVKNYISVLHSSKDKILNMLKDFENFLENVKNRSGTENERDDILARARALNNTVLELTGPKLDILPQMIAENIFSNMEKYQQELRNSGRDKTVSLTEKDVKQLESIADIGLRECVYRELMTDSHSSFDEAFNAAEKIYKERTDRLLESGREKILGRMKKDLEKHNLDTSQIDHIIREGIPLTEKVAEEISHSVDESIRNELQRKKAIGIILRAIRKRGFIFNPQQGIKLDRERNVVKIAVKRTDGRQVEFEVYLDGHFMYHFEGYEGMACTKDESPFINDLENVYGMKFSERHIEWENPDKLQNKKMQVMHRNIRHDKG